MKILKAFLLFTGFLLVLPFSNPLANSLNNPNTSFADYPEPLQQAFAESANTSRGDTWSKEILGMINSTHAIERKTLGLPEFILVNGKHINAQVTQDKNFVYVDARTSVKVSKSSCELIELDKGRIADNLATRKTTDYTILVSDDAVTWNSNAKTCDSVNWITNSTGSFVFTKQTIGETQLTIIYAWYEDKHLHESFFIPKNNGNSKYLAVQEKQSTNEKLVFNTDEYQTSNAKIKKTSQTNSITKSEHIKSKQNTTSYTFEYKKSGSQDLIYDIRGAKQYFDSVKISQVAGKLVTEILYVNDAKLSAGQSYIIDPTFGFTAADSSRFPETDTGSGTSCQPPISVSATHRQMQLPGSAVSSVCIIASFQWNISSISDSVDVTDVVVKYTIDGVTQMSNCDWNEITHNITLADATTLWNDITNNANGTTYVNADSGCTTASADKTLDLGTTADSDVEAQLTDDDLFSLGLNYDSLTRDADSHQNNWGTTGDASFRLQITYSTPTTQLVKFRAFENDGTTAVASATVIVTNSTTTASCTTNSTGVCGTFGIQSLTNHNVTLKTPTNYVFYKQLNWKPTANQTETRSGNIYDVTGCDSTLSNLMANQTDRDYLASVPLSPACSSDVLTFNYFFKPMGTGNSPSNQTTTVRFEIPATSVYARSQTIYVNGTAVSMTYSNGVMTSGAIQVGTGNQNVIIKFRLPFTEIIPQPPINQNAKINGTTGSYQVDTLTIKWTPSNATWTSGYRIYNSTNNVSYSLTTSGLANGTTFYNHFIGEHSKLMYCKVYSEPYSAGSPASTTVYNRTATFPDAPTGLTITNPSVGQLKLSWSAGTSDGNSTRKDCSIRFDNTTSGDVAECVTEITNSTISGTCTNRQYTKSSINGGTIYTFQVREGNSQGFSAWSSNTTGTVSTPTDITIRLFVNQTGDAVQIIPRVTFVSGNTGSGVPSLESIRFYNASSGTLINSTTINKVFSSSSPTFNYTRMYEDGLGMQGSNYNIVIQVSNYSASGTISTTENATLTSFKAKYRTLYQTAETASEGTYNYTVSRNSNQNSLALAVNRVTDTTFWDLECSYTDQIFETGTWVNKSSVIAYNITTTVDARSNVIVKCWNDNQVFTFVSFSATNGTLVVTQYTKGLGEFFGVPLPFLIVIFVSAVITPKNVPLGLIILVGTIGTMGVMGFWFDSNNNALITGAVWGAIVLLAAIGIFRGKTSPY